jgi:tRNA G46 methylase TrmB
MKVGIAIDPWKQTIFERRLTAASFGGHKRLLDDGMVLYTTDIEEYRLAALKKVVEAANIEAAKAADKRG